MAWPQYTVIFLYVLTILCYVLKDIIESVKRNKVYPYNTLSSVLIGTPLSIYILHKGGFWQAGVVN